MTPIKQTELYFLLHEYGKNLVVKAEIEINYFRKESTIKVVYENSRLEDADYDKAKLKLFKKADKFIKEKLNTTT